MDIQLMQMTDERNKVRKTPTRLSTYSGTLKDDCSILSPIITIQAPTISGNYALIPEFGNRYYYIDDVISIRNGLWEVHMTNDPLMTWRSGILALEAVIARQENVFNLFLTDPQFKVYNYDSIRTLEFPAGFNDNQEFVLAVIGGDHAIT